MAHKGFIKLYRDSSTHWLYCAEPFDKWHAWQDLLLLANYSETKRLYKGEFQITKAGQLQTSEQFLADRWRWSRSKVRRFLILLETDSMIERSCDSEHTTITIVNWKKYQNTQKPLERTGANSKATQNRTANRTADDTSKPVEKSTLAGIPRTANDTADNTSDDTTRDTYKKNNKRIIKEGAQLGIAQHRALPAGAMKIGDIFTDDDGFSFIMKTDGSIDRYRGKRSKKQ